MIGNVLCDRWELHADDLDDVDALAEYLLTHDFVCMETINVVCDINGWSVETMCDILYAVSGERNFDDFVEDEEEEDEEDDD